MKSSFTLLSPPPASSLQQPPSEPSLFRQFEQASNNHYGHHQIHPSLVALTGCSPPCTTPGACQTGALLEPCHSTRLGYPKHLTYGGTACLVNKDFACWTYWWHTVWPCITCHRVEGISLFKPALHLLVAAILWQEQFESSQNAACHWQ